MFRDKTKQYTVQDEPYLQQVTTYGIWVLQQFYKLLKSTIFAIV